MKSECVDINSGKKRKYIVEPDGSYFVYNKGSNRWGHRYTKAGFDSLYSIAQTDENAAWHRRLKRAVSYMQKSGMWKNEILPMYKDLLTITYDDLIKLRAEYWVERQKPHAPHKPGTPYKEIKLPTPKYQELFHKYGFDLLSDISDCRLKSMYFGKENTVDIRLRLLDAIQNKKDYDSGTIPVQYDVHVEYNGSGNRGWYSEEYRNCGNGHYYLALDHMHAVFYEND